MVPGMAVNAPASVSPPNHTEAGIESGPYAISLYHPSCRRFNDWKVRTQDPEKLDEEVKSLVTAWRLLEKRREHRQLLPFPFSLPASDSLSHGGWQ